MLKISFSIFFIFSILFSQIENGGNPKFYDMRIDDVDFLRVESNQEIDRQFNPMVFQFGHEYVLNVNVLNQSIVIQDETETTFLLGIESPGAYGLGITFSSFNLSDNSRLFFYDDSRTFKMGSFNSTNNKPSKSLTTSIIKSDKIILEL